MWLLLHASLQVVLKVGRGCTTVHQNAQCVCAYPWERDAETDRRLQCTRAVVDGLVQYRGETYDARTDHIVHGVGRHVVLIALRTTVSGQPVTDLLARSRMYDRNLMLIQCLSAVMDVASAGIVKCHRACTASRTGESLWTYEAVGDVWFVEFAETIQAMCVLGAGCALGSLGSTRRCSNVRIHRSHTPGARATAARKSCPADASRTVCIDVDAD